MISRDPNPEAVRKLGELIQGIHIAMLTTVAADGSLRSRPMAAQTIPFDGDLWFFTSDDSPKADEISREHEVNVSYADAERQRFVSVCGTALLVHDKAKARALWQPMFDTWFPGGLDDPHLGLLKVRVATAEYWDASSGKMTSLHALTRAAYPEAAVPVELIENEKIEVHADTR